jgi:serine-type D-Ala-D-Ala carboxypeptidase (penicillin-binding protein 5/6)
MTGRRRHATAIAAAVLAAGMTALTASSAIAGLRPAGNRPGPPLAASQPDSGDWTQGGAQLASRGVVVNYPPGQRATRLPNVPADAFVVANADTGQVLAAKDAHGWFRPASTLKVLTAVTLIPLLNPDATTVASSLAADTQPNDVGLIAGRAYQISGLFTALLTISANDAAVALAQATGSYQRGMDLINDEAHELQAYDTVAKQPNGLDQAGQHTSAYDEALIARHALTMPAFLGYDRTLSARFEIKPKHWVTLVNQDQMLTDYPGDIGGKLGWTSAAGATYMGMARRNGVTLIVTILHCPPLTEFTYATRLLNWGFAMNGKVRPVGVLVPPLPAQVRHRRHRRQRHPALAVAAAGVPVAPLLAASGIIAAAGLAGSVGLMLRKRGHPA